MINKIRDCAAAPPLSFPCCVPCTALFFFFLCTIFPQRYNLPKKETRIAAAFAAPLKNERALHVVFINCCFLGHAAPPLAAQPTLALPALLAQTNITFARAHKLFRPDWPTVLFFWGNRSSRLDN